MDLRARLLSLLEPIAVGDELAPGVRLCGASTELGLRLTFDAHGREVHVEVNPAEDGVKHAARTRRLTFAYRTHDAEPIEPAAGRALCAQVARAIAPREDAILDEVAAEAAALAATDPPRIRDVVIDRLLEPAGPPGQRFYTLSPYVGCLIGCRFCYAQSRLTSLRRFAGLAAAPWGSWVDVRANAPAILAEELTRLPPRPIKFCPIVSDPYHAIEERRGLTRRCLEVIAAAAAPPPTLLLTRAALVVRDAALLAALPRAWVGMSIPTADDAVRAHFEPRAASIDLRVATLRALRAAGVRRVAVVQPMLPGPVDALADLLAETVASVSLDVLRGEEGATALFDDPRYRAARADAWQQDQAHALRAALAARGVPVWSGELPPELSAGAGPASGSRRSAPGE